MSIKPFKGQHLMSKSEAEKSWAKLEVAIDEIYNKNASQLYFEEVYRTAYNMVLQKHGDMLYRGVTKSFQTHANKTFNEIYHTHDEELLDTILKCWIDHRTTIAMVKDILMYMDRTYIVHQKLTPVYDNGVNIFRETIIYNSEIKTRLQRLLLENISNERNGEIIDIPTMKGVLSMFMELGLDGEKVYEKEFEGMFLSSTRTFYREESLLFLSRNTCPDYIRKVDSRLGQESQRVVNYLSKTTEPKLKQILESELISAHAQSLVDMEGSGCFCMLRENKLGDLKAMYTLFSRVPVCLRYIQECVGEFVRRAGEGIIADQEKTKDQPVVFVQKVLDLKSKFDTIVHQCFQGDQKFLKVLKDSFESFMNRDNRTAAYLALYVDDLLKSGLRGVPESEAEERMDQIIVIFRHIHDKDVFESYYKSFLSKRLLSGKVTQDEMERTMLSKLKTECGYQFTSKLEGMFTDMRVSRTVMEAYLQHRQQLQRSTGGMECEVSVLTAGFWPSSPDPAIILPPEVVNSCCDPFTAFYLTQHSGRKLSWQLHLGNADLRANFTVGRRELCVSTYQMCILMLFNEADTLSLNEVRERTAIPETELRRHLLSLCTPKFRILTKLSKVKGITDDDSFTFNAAYTSKLRRVKIPLISSKEVTAGTSDSSTVDSFAAVPAGVEEDRRHLVEATIVRIMKARKTLSHNDLIGEALRQSSHRFAADAMYVKRRIESLIEREYLQRDKDDRRVYNYLA